jgi:uncharacterized membrane protein
MAFLVIQPYRRNYFVRFHSLQCLLATGAVVAFVIALSVVSTILRHVPLIGPILVLLAWPLCVLAGISLWGLVVFKSYQHEIFKLPVVGDLAERHAERA